ncbi:MAG: hypothetical protein M1834_002227 [Cirrosporium novae-zelandiae]|nr:MAG: hypothetical protein M1834_002227 [Cirrosporium novae-zelandiae]
MTSIFLTGATGYIGGSVLQTLTTVHPEYNISVLVRNAEKATQISNLFPRVRIVTGDLDGLDLIEKEVQEADVTIHVASSSHRPSIEAIARGLQKRAATNKSNPGFWLQISGASILSYPDISSNSYGEASSHIYDDLTGLSEVTSLPDTYLHRLNQKFVLDASSPAPSLIKTALIAPPIIYGAGTGIQKRSVQIPELARVTIQEGHGVQVGKGLSVWPNIHIEDVSRLFLRLVEEAVVSGSPETYKGNQEIWNQGGYYFAENGNELPWTKIATIIANSAHASNLIKDPTAIESITAERANALTPHGALLWGTNARGRALRAKGLLGWKPIGKSLEEEIPETVKVEARGLGLV